MNNDVHTHTPLSHSYHTLSQDTKTLHDIIQYICDHILSFLNTFTHNEIHKILHDK